MLLDYLNACKRLWTERDEVELLVELQSFVRSLQYVSRSRPTISVVQRIERRFPSGRLRPAGDSSSLIRVLNFLSSAEGWTRAIPTE